GGDAEEDEGPQADIHGGADFIDQAVHAQLVVAGHGRDLFLDVLARADEERQDQVLWRQIGFADEGADHRVVAQAARSAGGEHWRSGLGNDWDTSASLADRAEKPSPEVPKSDVPKSRQRSCFDFGTSDFGTSGLFRLDLPQVNRLLVADEVILRG